MLRIAVVHDWNPDIQQELTWKDGLAAAIKVLSERHEVKFITVGPDIVLPHPYFPIHMVSDVVDAVEAFNPDIILHWADCTRPNAEPLSKLGIPMALCFAGGNPMGETNRFFDHFFVESQVYFGAFERLGKSVSVAFGTNTELFQPYENQPKYFDAIFPATFCDWKRHSLFADAVKGMKACAVGFMYPVQEDYCWKACEKAGVLTLPHASAEMLHRLYAASKTCVVTSRSDGGSQRTVLEAMAMNLPLIVMEDSDKTSEYVREGGGQIVHPDPVSIRFAIERAEPVNTRPYILSKWSEHVYAKNIEDGLLKCLESR